MALTHFGMEPCSIITPYTSYQVQVLCSTLDNWAILRCIYSGNIDNHYPKHPLLQFTLTNAFIFPKITKNQPIVGAIDVFTDGSKTGVGSYVVNNEVFQKHFSVSSPQLVECAIVAEVLRAFPQPVNIISDSHYVVGAVQILETMGLISSKSNVAQVFADIQQSIRTRVNPFFIQHMRAHTLLPGPMSKANDLADKATRAVFLSLNSVQHAATFHELYHVPAETLR